MILKRFICCCIIVAACNLKDEHVSKVSVDSLKVKSDSLVNSFTPHLKDTAFVRADCVAFLRPDSLIFNSSKEEEGSYEADSDFGFAISEAMDSIKRSLKGVTTYVITERFLKIIGCKGCPKIIDRDTIYYGNILISRKKGIQINSGILAGHYSDQIEEYFK